MNHRLAVAAAFGLLQACAAPLPGPAPEVVPAAVVVPEVPVVPEIAVPEVAFVPIPSQPAEPPPVVFAPPPLDAEPVEIVEPLRGVQGIDRTTVHDDLWQRIRAGFAMPDLDNEVVQERTAFYVARPDYLQRMFDRSRLYLFHIVEELEKRHLPTELALLPMVESAFNPMAYSRAHASGLWQFIPGTGRRFELQQNWWYDARRDVVASTKAALDYLSFLYEMHGDWHLALASYNWGEGAVARAIARNEAAGLPTDYWSLAMPLETRHYIPKLQALKNIINDPEPFEVVLGPIPNRPYFATYAKGRDIDVYLAAKLAEMPVAQFVALNPGFNRPLIRAAVTPRIVLPADRVDVFHRNLVKRDPKTLVSWKTYQPKKGETFESIAKRHGMTLAQLKQVNGIAPPIRALPGLLVVPASRAALESYGSLPLMHAPPVPALPRRIVHTIKRGETFASIARRYGVTETALRRWNPGLKPTPGQRLHVEVTTTHRRQRTRT
jgi:membrane-bound lytic murein transglycosylase D